MIFKQITPVWHINFLLTLLIIWFTVDSLAAQSSHTHWNEQRMERTRYSMMVLGGWAAANVAVGAVGMSRSTGSTRAFHQMNLGWGAINMGLAVSGYWTATQTDPATLSGWESQQALIRLRQIFLFNAGLDVGYMAAGAWMLERAKNASTQADRWRGFGRSIILQGAFLFVFDLGAFWYHGPMMEQLRPLFNLTHTRLEVQPGGLSCYINF
jgi:hypothetical protein